jgi:DSBA-like thioredoxin domain
MSRSFSVTWDYRCPFLVFSLEQTHVEEGGTPVWEEPERHPGLAANLAGVVVRDRMPEQFLSVHEALFSARHDQGLDLRDPSLIANALDAAGVDSAEILAEVKDGWPLEVLKREHSDAVERLSVFGVPTFISETDAVFVRLMNRPAGDAALATSTIERVLDLVEGWPELNEFKHTAVLR